MLYSRRVSLRLVNSLSRKLNLMAHSQLKCNVSITSFCNLEWFDIVDVSREIAIKNSLNW